ncbi:hypothetical protein MIND_00364000 [Mycena indigotica]|uniref:RING-type domain-containing protein n=1 Tax=Mycena indigotica TaxID=2126181 RepID=A0A8H6W9Q0_9AGAR|nr:uncharacterized protein MIND_00364000 [Mycena indigotica]KAF7309917.1 hypothetical protein MIND_00364000 [Mycena indigotica]
MWQALTFVVHHFLTTMAGHCFCRPCITQIVRCPKPQRRCPNCRAVIRGADDAQPIFLEIVAVKPMASMVAEGLGRMDADARVVSVQKAGKKLDQVAATEGIEREVLIELLQAITDFNARIVPVFVKAREQEAEIIVLKKQLEDAQTLRDQADLVLQLKGEAALLRANNLKLRQDLKASEEQTDQAVKLVAERAQEVKKTQAKLDDIEVRGQSEIRRLKGLLERNADDRNRERQKIGTISSQRDSLQQQLVALQKEFERVREDDDDLEIVLDDAQSSEMSEPPRPTQPLLPTPGRMVKLGFEGMPKPGFSSDWQLGRGTKRKEREETTTVGLKQGGLLQLGPKRTIRVKAVQAK